jgi:hypothetical protein
MRDGRAALEQRLQLPDQALQAFIDKHTSVTESRHAMVSTNIESVQNRGSSAATSPCVACIMACIRASWLRWRRSCATCSLARWSMSGRLYGMQLPAKPARPGGMWTGRFLLGMVAAMCRAMAEPPPSTRRARLPLMYGRCTVASGARSAASRLAGGAAKLLLGTPSAEPTSPDVGPRAAYRLVPRALLQPPHKGRR